MPSARAAAVGRPSHRKRERHPISGVPGGCPMVSRHPPTSSFYASVHPAMNVWLVLILVCAAGGALVYWYMGQKRLLSPRALALVTAIRLAMILLIFLCLLRPSISWRRVQRVPGSLWLVVDHSQSMSIKDGPHSPVTELRWACALGYLKPGVYNDAADRAAAWADVLAQRLRNVSREIGAGGAEKRSGERQIRRQLEWWSKYASRLIGHLSTLRNADAVAHTFKSAQNIANRMEGHLRESTVHGNAYADLSSAASALNRASKQLTGMAEARDKAFLAAQGRDPDVILALNRVGGMSRTKLAIAALLSNRAQNGKSFAGLTAGEQVHVVSFAAHAYNVGRASPIALRNVLRNAMNPTGKATDITAGLMRATDEMKSPASSKVLVVSDGRQNMGPDPGPIARLLLARGTPTYTLCVGSGFDSPLVRIQAVHAPTWIFRHQKMHAVALVSIRDLADHPVKIYLSRNGKLIDSRTLLATSRHSVRTVRFSNTLNSPGVYRYQLRIGHIAGSLYRGKVQKSFRVTVRRDKLQVLVVDNQPRWEYQYLVNYFSRSGRVHLQAVLLHPATIAGVTPPKPIVASPSNPLYTASSLPTGKRAWGQFNLIILGDIPPHSLSAADQQALAYAVETQGSALVLIAGQNYMPGAWKGTALARLIPVKLKPVWAPSVMREQERSGFAPLLTPEGVESDLSDLGIDRSRNNRFWRDMPRWYWHSTFTDARPDARVLWMIGNSGGIGSNSGGGNHQRALLATMSAGSGRVLYLASDQTWRMRSDDGHNLENAFLAQLVRWSVGTQLPVGGKWVRFGANRTHYVFGQTVHVRARILHTNLLPDAHLQFQVRARLIHSRRNPKEVGAMQSAPMIAIPGSPGFYSGVLTDLKPGSYSITLKGDHVGQKLADDPTAVNRNEIIRIRPRKNLEMLDPAADPRAMEQLASAGGGVMVTGPAYSILAAAMPPQKHTLRSVNTIGLLTSAQSRGTAALQWLFMIFFAVLAAAEWIIRKAKGLI
ncbi:MAG: hypothetical protein ACP5O1_05800 [Phycisphaerae bacterium]